MLNDHKLNEREITEPSDLSVQPNRHITIDRRSTTSDTDICLVQPWCSVEHQPEQYYCLFLEMVRLKTVL